MHLEKKLRKIPLELIDAEDDFFDFSDKDSSYLAKLKLSIKKVGVINPLIVQLSSSKKLYRLINGFKRFQIAKELSLSYLPAYILKRDLSPLEVLNILLLSHSRPLSLTEKARIVGIMRRLQLSDKQIYDNFGSLLGISSASLVKEYAILSTYRSPLLSYISSHGLSLKQALALKDLSSQEQDTFVFLGNLLSLKGYDFFNILTDLKEIAIREGKKVALVIEETGILEIGKNEKFTRSQKIERIKNIIKERKYPYLTKVNRELDKIRKKFSSRTGLDIVWDKSLEGGVELSFKIRNSEDAKKKIKNLLEEDNFSLLVRFLEVYHEGLQDKKDNSG